MSKKAKKRPKPVYGWAVVEDGKICGELCFNTRSDAVWWCGSRPYDGVIRVRIVPVVAKRRKGAK